MAEVPAIDFKLIPDKQVTAAILNPYDRITWPHRSQMHINLAKMQVRQIISSGIRQGQSYSEMARELKNRLDITAGKAQTIARTEGHRAREMGKLAATQKAADQGLIFKRRWVATLDKVTRDTHGAMDGQEIDVYDENGKPGLFVTPLGDTTEFPGGFGVAAEDINCRCTVTDIYKGFEPTMRRAREDDLIEYTTYDDYAEMKGWPRPYAGWEPKVVSALAAVGEVAAVVVSDMVIAKTAKGYIVKSKTGKILGGPYKTKRAAEEKLRQLNN